MLSKILAGLGTVLALFLIYVALQPSHYHVERSIAIEAPAEIVFAQIEDLRKWAGWSPWENIDPNLKRSYEGPERGVGASYTWQGNSDVGSGKMTVVNAKPAQSVAIKLEFREPMASEAQAAFDVRKEGASAHKVTWGMDGEHNYIGKMFCVFMDMDKMLGGQFEKGLQKLKDVAEGEAKKQRAEQAPSAAASAPEAPAPAAAPGQ